MSDFKKLIPALALVVALAPFAAGAVTTQGPAHKFGYVSGTAISQFAANSKGRPGEFTPANAHEVAVNSKGRPGENNLAASQVADNSKGRASEFPPSSSTETPFG